VRVHGHVATCQQWARYSFDTYQLYSEPDHAGR
jgi:hypothetical protein